MVDDNGAATDGVDIDGRSREALDGNIVDREDMEVDGNKKGEKSGSGCFSISGSPSVSAASSVSTFNFFAPAFV